MNELINEKKTANTDSTINNDGGGQEVAKYNVDKK
jgi:hypothetical protein